MSIDNLSFAYKKNEPILKNISCKFQSGDVIGLIGENGQGKSTFSKILCGLNVETSGTVKWNNNLLKAKQRQTTSYLVMQEPGYQLFSDSVEQEMRMTSAVLTGEEISEILSTLKLLKYAEKHPLSLSGGEKQRLSFGVAMVQNRDILIMDEPTSGLDYANMIRVADLVHHLRERGKIVIIITHDYEFILQTCNKILHLENGNITHDYMLDDKKLNTLRDFFVPKKEKL